MRPRLDSSVFDLPVQELRRGYLSDVYFWRQKVVLERNSIHPDVTMQLFQKKDAIICGVDEAIAVLKVASGFYTDYSRAYTLFDRLMEIKKQSRHSFLSNKQEYIDWVQQKVEVSQELDSLWVNGFSDLKVEALFDGAR